MAHRLMAGVSLVDISPGPGIELDGYPHHPRHNKGVHDPLYAGCIWLDDGGVKLAFVSLDLLMLSKKEVHAARDEIARQTPIPAQKVMITRSHTHSGPWTSGRLDMEGLEQDLAPDPGYLSLLRRKIASVVKEAWDGRFEAAVGVQKGICGREKGVGGNRRDPDGIADPEVWVIGVRDAAGRTRGCLVRYALHPTFLHSNNMHVSADYPGCIRNHLASRAPGMTLLFAQGCSGDQSPRYFRSAKTYSEAIRAGSAIGEEAARVLKTMEFHSDARLLVKSVETDLETRVLPSLADSMKAVETARALGEGEVREHGRTGHLER